MFGLKVKHNWTESQIFLDGKSIMFGLEAKKIELEITNVWTLNDKVHRSSCFYDV